MKRYLGELMLATGLLHCIVGALLYRDVFTEIGMRNIVASIPDFGDRAAAFWFMMFGFVLIYAALITRQHIRDGHAAPAFAAAFLLIANLAGAMMMPASGLWILVALAVLAIYSASAPSRKMN